jgi:hypothetical protein
VPFNEIQTIAELPNVAIDMVRFIEELQITRSRRGPRFRKDHIMEEWWTSRMSQTSRADSGENSRGSHWDIASKFVIYMQADVVALTSDLQTYTRLPDVSISSLGIIRRNSQPLLLL